MEGEKSFPFEVKSLTEAELEIFRKCYKSDIKYIRCGPKGYVLTEEFMDHAADIYNMPVLPTDVFVVTFPRSGTTWTQELVWLLANDLDYDRALSNPLVGRYYFIEQYIMFNAIAKLKTTREDTRKELNSMKAPHEVLGETPSPRFIKSHLPISLLPASTLDTAKVVYVARDPRDVMVSCYNFYNNHAWLGQKGDFKSFVDVFLHDTTLWSPFFDHIKEAWAQRNHPNMMFLFYEELSKDLKGAASRVARFLGKQYTDEQLDRLCDHLKFENFKKNQSVDIQNWKDLGLFADGKNFVRKGKVGGWREYFDEELTRRVDRWMEDKLRDVDLRFLTQ